MSDLPEDALFSEARLLLEAGQIDEARWRRVLAALLSRGLAQDRLLERLTRLSDGYQRAERDRGNDYLRHYERELKRIEKIVRISDRYQLMLQEANQQLAQVAKTDQLTGLPNRRCAAEVIESQIKLVSRQSASLVLGILDVDYFKSINDRFGHAAGDLALTRLAEVLRQEARGYDFCARWGGEEFLLLLPFTTLIEAHSVLERLRRRIEQLSLAFDGQIASLTVSIGCAAYDEGELSHQWLQRADVALYQAKQAGRNQVHMADGPEASAPGC